MKISKILAACVAAASVASIAVVAASAADYTASIYVQTAPYSFRNQWQDSQYGKETPYWADKFIVWGGNDPETFPELEDKYDYDIDGYVIDATYTDVTVSGNGTYKVTAETDFTLDKAQDLNLLGVATDIPWVADEEGTFTGGTVSDVKVYFDGTCVDDNAVVFLESKDDFLNIGICNIWGDESIKNWSVDSYPTAKIDVEFTIDGLQEEANIPDDEPADDNTDKPAEETPAKPNTNTGAEGIAVAAGVAVLATGAIVVSKKRK